MSQVKYWNYEYVLIIFVIDKVTYGSKLKEKYFKDNSYYSGRQLVKIRSRQIFSSEKKNILAFVFIA